MKRIDLKQKTVLITGAAGFIGANMVRRLLLCGDTMTIIGLDSMTDYYDVSLKEYRLKELEKVAESSSSVFTMIEGSIADRELVQKLFAENDISVVVNLAGQAGVRYSIENPDSYIEANIVGFYYLLEACRHSYDGGKRGVEHLVYASSSSVYGSNNKIPYSVEGSVDHPISLYAATKKTDELLAHAYSKLYEIPSTGLRFFTVYGPAGRPDMAYFGFTNRLVKREKIKIFNYGKCERDFTFVDDVTEGILRVMRGAPERQTGEDGLPIPPYQLYNIGNSKPVGLMDFIGTLAEELIRAGVLPEDFDVTEYEELVPMQPGDVPVTFSDTSALERDYGFRPHTELREGLRRFAEWYRDFYKRG